MAPPAWDYQHAYPGGPMVAVDGFPRPLHYPDNPDGYPAAVDGEDALAYKAIVSRLGRWLPWDPSSWDDSFSRAFALGRGPDLKDSGVIGCQRQQPELGETGYVGEKTFNFFRAARIPEGLPHSGEPAMDAHRVEMINRAYARFGGKEPAAAATSARQKALDHMHERLGYTEQPDGSNCDQRTDGIRTSQDHTANGTWLRGEPWCGCWCYYALETAGVSEIDSSLASVAQIEDNARAGAKCFTGWTTDPSRSQPGDLVVIGGYGVHVEMVRAKPSPSSTATYGGNTSPGTSGSQANGGGAYARTRYRQEIRGYALVQYPDD